MANRLRAGKKCTLHQGYRSHYLIFARWAPERRSDSISLPGQEPAEVSAADANAVDSDNSISNDGINAIEFKKTVANRRL
jgi:hypothetical protein